MWRALAVVLGIGMSLLVCGFTFDIWVVLNNDRTLLHDEYTAQKVEWTKDHTTRRISLRTFEKCRDEMISRFPFLGGGGDIVYHAVRQVYNTSKLKSSVTVDVGANIGQGLKFMKESFSRVSMNRMYLWEPGPINLKYLKKALKNFSNYTLIEGPATAVEGNVSIWLATNSYSQMGGLFSKGGVHFANGVPFDKLDILGLPLDSFLGSEGRIDWLKIDVEGAEAHVLEGGYETLQKTDLVFYESKGLFPGFGENRSVSGFHLAGFLRELGFDVFLVGHQELVRIDGLFWDAVYDSSLQLHNTFAIRKTHPKYTAIVGPFLKIYSSECQQQILLY